MSEEEYEEQEFMGMTYSLLEHAAGSGFTTMNPEEDGVTRWAPLVMEYDGYLYPSLPFQVVLHQFGTDLRDVRFEEGAIVIPRKIGSEIRVPVDDRKRILLNFRYDRTSGIEDEEKAGFLQLNYWTLIDGFRSLEPGEGKKVAFTPFSLNEKILIVGSSAAATFDLRAIPISERFPAVRILGTIIRSIEQEDFLHEAPPIVNFFWIIGGAFLVGCLGQIFAPIKHAAATLLLVFFHALSSFGLFAHFGLVVDFIHVTFAEIMAYAVVTVSQYLQVSSLFGRYVTPEVRRFLMSKSGALQLGGQETEVSILFSDLKGFTNMSEKLEAKQVISALNDYFGPMFEIIIDKNYGTLDKLIGDAIMAYFGHPLPTPNHPVQAVTAALMMQKRLAELRQQWEKEGKPTIRMRIGVNTGTVVAGNMGSAGRTDYSIIGDNVNLAARLESNAPVDGVLISESTYERTKDHFVFKEREPIQVKGKEKPVKVYEALDFK
jgi:adenylate cyclase